MRDSKKVFTDFCLQTEIKRGKTHFAATICGYAVGKVVDNGIGPYEFWGAHYTDSSLGVEVLNVEIHSIEIEAQTEPYYHFLFETPGQLEEFIADYPNIHQTLEDYVYENVESEFSDEDFYDRDYYDYE